MLHEPAERTGFHLIFMLLNEFFHRVNVSLKHAEGVALNLVFT